MYMHRSKYWRFASEIEEETFAAIFFPKYSKSVISARPSPWTLITLDRCCVFSWRAFSCRQQSDQPEFSCRFVWRWRFSVCQTSSRCESVSSTVFCRVGVSRGRKPRYAGSQLWRSSSSEEAYASIFSSLTTNTGNTCFVAGRRAHDALLVREIAWVISLQAIPFTPRRLSFLDSRQGS